MHRRLEIGYKILYRCSNETGIIAETTSTGDDANGGGVCRGAPPLEQGWQATRVGSETVGLSGIAVN